MNRLPCFKTWTEPRSVAFSIRLSRGSKKRTPSTAAPFAFAEPAPVFNSAAEAGAVDWEVGWAGGDCWGIGEVTAEPAELVGPVAAWLLRAIVASGEGAEALRLIGHYEGVDQSIDVPVHNSWQRRQVESDSMIRHPILGEVVGADLVRTIAGADHRPARDRVGLALLRELAIVEPRSQDGHCLGLVLVLALLVLDLHDEARRQVGDPHRRVGRVDGLAAGPRGPFDVDPEVLLLVDVDLERIGRGHDDDRRRGGVDPPRRLGRRDPLDAMDATLELQAAVGAVAVDLEDRLLDPVDGRVVAAQDLGGEAMLLGIAGVHPEKLAGEQGRFVATGAGPYLHDHVAVVIRVPRQQQHLQPVEEIALVLLQAGDLVAGHALELVVGVRAVAQLAGTGKLRPGCLETPERGDNRLEPGQLPAETADRIRIRGDLGPGELGLEVVVLVGNLGELRVEIGARHRDRHTPGSGGSIVTGAADSVMTFGASGSRSPTPGGGNGERSSGALPDGIGSPSASSACSIETIATSIMPSVGWRVVIIWTRMPGHMIERTIGLARCLAPQRRSS